MDLAEEKERVLNSVKSCMKIFSEENRMFIGEPVMSSRITSIECEEIKDVSQLLNRMDTHYNM